METSAQQDEQFFKWITSKTAEIYWECENGQRVKLKPGWEKHKQNMTQNFSKN